MKFLAKSIVPIRVTAPKVLLPTSDIRLSDRYSRRKNLIPLNEFESSLLILLYDKFNTRSTALRANAPLKDDNN